MSNEAKVGLFVLVSLAIFVISFIAIANVHLRGDLVRYKTYFSFAGGLERGAVVRFGGLKVGRVAEVRSWSEDPTKVEILLDVQPNTPIRQDSVAQVSSLGPLGENYLEIKPGERNAPPLAPGGTIHSIEAVDFSTLARKVSAVADSTQALVADLHAKLSSISDKADTLLANLNQLTGEKNRQSLEQLLERSNQMVADQAPKIDRTMDTIERTTQKMEALVTELRGTNQRAADAISNINRTVDETREPLKQDLEEIRLTIVEARELVEQLRGTLTYNDENINRTLENFRAASQHLEEFASEIKQRPFSLIRVRPKPDRKVPVAGAQ